MFGCFSSILLKYAHIKPFPISNPSKIEETTLILALKYFNLKKYINVSESKC